MKNRKIPFLHILEIITQKRLLIWQQYYDAFKQLQPKIKLPTVPENCQHNGHIFYLIMRSKIMRDALIQHLRDQGIQAMFHYQSLHLSEAGERFGKSLGQLVVTEDMSGRLIRLPLYIGMRDDEISCVVDALCQCEKY